MKFTFSAIDLFYISPIIILFFTSLVPLLSKVLNKNEEKKSGILNFILPLVGVFLASASILLIGGDLLNNDNSGVLIFSNALVIDGVSVLMSLLVCAVTFFTVILAKESAAINKSQFSEFIFLLLNASIGMLTVVFANDLMVLFIGIEMMSLCVYILVAMSLELKLSKEAAIKYFVLGSFASAILIYGISFVYGASGSTYFPEVAKQAMEGLLLSKYFILGVSLILFGLAFKVSLFPFYSWTPDVYQGSSTPLTAYMATGVKVVSFVAILRFVAMNFLDQVEAVTIVNALQWLAVLTMLVGNIAAIKQNNLKRMLAYSSVAHSGYVLVGIIAIASPTGAEIGASGVLFYLVSYVIMTFGAFATLSVFEKTAETSLTFNDLKGLARRSPYFALVFSILMLSLAGIPPTLGFFGKFYLFSAAVSQGFYWLAVWGVLSSVVSVYYYLRPLVLMYMSDEEGVSLPTGYWGTKMTVTLTGVIIVVVGLASSPLYSQISKSVSALF